MATIMGRPFNPADYQSLNPNWGMPVSGGATLAAPVMNSVPQFGNPYNAVYGQPPGAPGVSDYNDRNFFAAQYLGGQVRPQAQQTQFGMPPQNPSPAVLSGDPAMGTVKSTGNTLYGGALGYVPPFGVPRSPMADNRSADQRAKDKSIEFERKNQIASWQLAAPGMRPTPTQQPQQSVAGSGFGQNSLGPVDTSDAVRNYGGVGQFGRRDPVFEPGKNYTFDTGFTPTDYPGQAPIRNGLPDYGPQGRTFDSQADPTKRPLSYDDWVAGNTQQQSIPAASQIGGSYRPNRTQVSQVGTRRIGIGGANGAVPPQVSYGNQTGQQQPPTPAPLYGGNGSIGPPSQTQGAVQQNGMNGNSSILPYVLSSLPRSGYTTLTSRQQLPTQTNVAIRRSSFTY